MTTQVNERIIAEFYFIFHFFYKGPLMMRIDARWTQLGIVSFGNKCGEPGYPGVYTRISEYMDWIRETTKN